MRTAVQDLRYALRMLRLNPGFTITAAGALALALGANTAIFSVVNEVLLQPLPYPHPERMVQLLVQANWGEYRYTSVPRFNACRVLTQVFEDVAAYDWNGGAGVNLTGGDRPAQVRGEHVSHEYFRLFGARMAAGRGFTPQEDRPGGGHAVVLSHGLWQRRFGGDPTLVGRAILLGGDPYTVVGITSPSFAPDPPADLWLPLQADPASTDQAQFLFAAARLRQGVTLHQARAALLAASLEFHHRFPNAIAPTSNFSAAPLRQDLTADVRTPLLILLAAVGCVLLIACANVAGLLLARATGRTREMAVRTAIGASRARIARQLLTESLVLSLAGGFAGLLLGVAGLRALLALDAGDIPRIGTDGARVTLDGRGLLYTFLATIVTGIVFGLAPALQASRVDLNSALKESGSRSGGRRHNRARRILIVSEVAIAFILLTGAGLLIRTLAALYHVAPGFDIRHVLTMESALDGSRYARTSSVAEMLKRCEERIMRIAGVEAVAEAPSVPLESSIGMTFRIAGRPLGDRNYHGVAWWRYVSGRYFDVYRIPIVRGRGFTERDTAGAPPVVLIDATMARTSWPNADPIGQRIRLDDGDPHSDEPYREIVGVAADVRELGLHQETGNATYVPLPQVTASTLALSLRIVPLTWAVRTRGAPLSVFPAVADALRQEAGLPVARVRSMDQVLRHSTARDRFNAVLFGMFALLAVTLAALGLYGLMAYSLEQRTREFGIRMALGSSNSQLKYMVVRQALTLAVVGILAGLGGALAFTRAMAGLLFGVKPADPLVFAAVAVLLLVVAWAASLAPARRTVRIDPAAALRSE